MTRGKMRKLLFIIWGYIKKSTDIEYDRNRTYVALGEWGEALARSEMCGSVNLADAFTKGGETHFKWLEKGIGGKEGVNPSVAEHFHIW